MWFLSTGTHPVDSKSECWPGTGCPVSLPPVKTGLNYDYWLLLTSSLFTCCTCTYMWYTDRQTPWHESTSKLYPIKWLLLVGEVSANSTFADRRCHVVSVKDPCGHTLRFLDRSHYFFFQVVPQLYSRVWVDPVPHPLLVRKSGSTIRPHGQSTFFCITYINSVRTSQETQYMSILQPGTLTTRQQRRSTFFYITYTFSSYLIGSTIHHRCVARNSDH
jgi:hypothetical protein